MYAYHFLAEIDGISVGQPVAFAQLSPLCRNIAMEQSTQGTVLIRVSKSRTWPEDVALNEATMEVEEFLDRLSLIDNHRVGALRYSGYSDENGNFHKHRDSGGCYAKLTAGLPDPLAYYALERQNKLLVGRVNPGLTRLHRVAQGMPNGIGKYLLLYGALQVMYGETQAEVDRQLLSVRPDTLMVNGKHRSETILSRLRNMIAHPENDVDVQTLSTQAEKYCPMLIEIVRNELVRQIQP